VSQHFILLLFGLFGCLLALVASGFWLLGDQEKRKRWQARREEAIGPYLRPKAAPATAPLMLAAKPKSATGILASIQMLYGYKESRRAHYPLTWWAAALLMLAPATVAAMLATKFMGESGWAVLPLGDILMTRMLLTSAANKVTTKLLGQFPDALSMIARSVRVGVPVGEAVRVVAREALSPTREEFAKTADQVAIGLDMEAALLEMADRTDLSEYRFFATALALQAQTGGGLTETLDTLADTIRKRDAARKRGIALASEAKTSIYVLTCLPVFSAGGLYLSNPDYISVLFTTAPGEKILGIAVFMLVTGLAIMNQMIKMILA
jgi:tight adherence protein B